jgi:hypothetical protein
MNGNIAQYIIDTLGGGRQQAQGFASLPKFGLQGGQPQGNSLLEYIDQLDANPVTMTPPMDSPLMAMPTQSAQVPQISMNQQAYGGPNEPVVPTRNVSQYIQEALGAKDARQPDLLQNILSERSQGPSFSDYSRAIQKSAYDTPTGAQDYADAGMKSGFEQIATLEKLNGSTDFDRLVSTYLNLPEGDPRRKLYEARITKETTPSAGALIQVYNPQTGQLQFATPEQIAAGGLQPPKAQPQLNATQQKEVFDTQDVITSSEAARSALERAKELMAGTYGAKPYSGAGAETATELNRYPGAGWFVNDERAAATTEYNTLVKEQALSTMKAIFGGNPTEGERQVLLQMQALANYTPQEQSRIIDNAIRAIDTRITKSQAKLQYIEGGGGYGRSAPSNAGSGWSAVEIP